MISSFQKILSHSESVKVSICSPCTTMAWNSFSPISSMGLPLRLATMALVSLSVKLILRPIASAVLNDLRVSATQWEFDYAMTREKFGRRDRTRNIYLQWMITSDHNHFNTGSTTFPNSFADTMLGRILKRRKANKDEILYRIIFGLLVEHEVLGIFVTGQ